MDKFGRLYELHIQGNDNQIHVIQFPLTCEFEIKRNLLASANTGTFRIYNLKLQTRNAINKDFLDILYIRSIKFFAGYSYPLTQCFTGNIKSCISYRDEGRVDWITEVQAYDFGFAMDQAYSNFSLPANSTKQQLITQLGNDMIKFTSSAPVQLSLGKFSTFTGTYPRGYAYTGFTWPRLILESSDQCFIDNGSLNVLQTNDTVSGSFNTVDSSSGLLSPPKRYQNCVVLELLFTPGIKAGQFLNVQSATSSQYNGQYKVSGFEHHGVISGAVNGKCKTNVFLIKPFWNVKQ